MPLRRHLVLPTAGVIFASTAWHVSAADCLPYEPETIVLSGTLSTRQAFGAPNYGENPATDARENYWLLSLGSPVCVVAGDPAYSEANVAENNVAAMQVVISTGIDLPSTGRRVEVTGRLFHAHTGHHRTAILILATKLQPAP